VDPRPGKSGPEAVVERRVGQGHRVPFRVLAAAHPSMMTSATNVLSFHRLL
jgi:hypothetical protein